MKTYEANNKLTKILIKQGFIETTSQINKDKEKKSFKLSKFARKGICFDYINIRVINSTNIYDSRIKMTESELKSLLLYFKLPANAFKEFDSNGRFNFTKTVKQIEKLRKELILQTELNINDRRNKKIKKIIDFYDKIKIKL